MKNILFIVHYFYPDLASTGQIMTELCQELQKEFNITVIAVSTSYTGSSDDNVELLKREKFQNINIKRVGAIKPNKKKIISRVLHIVTYFINTVIEIIRTEKNDYVFVISQPPIVGGLLGVITKLFKKSKLVYNIQDFNPEQVEAVNYLKNKLIIKLSRALDNISCRYSDRIVLVGKDMTETLQKRLPVINFEKVRIINNWIDDNEIFPLPKEHPKVQEFIRDNDLSGKYVIMYSGNIGLYYDLDNLVKIAGSFKENRDLVFVFIGDGAIKNNLIKICEENSFDNIRFLPYQKKDNLIYSLNAADVHLVCNKKGIKGVSVPSKIYGTMAVGKYIIGILENGSEAANLIQDSGSGVIAEPGDYDCIYECIKKVYSQDKNLLFEKGLKGREYLIKNYKKEQAIKKYIEMFSELI